MKLKLITREGWGARPAGNLATNSLSRESVLFIHWSAGQGRSIETLEEQKATMRAIQAYHMDPKPKGQAWSDIGYSYVVFQPYGLLRRARVFQGRKFANVPASQYGYNTGNGSVCVVMAEGEKLKRSTRRLIREIHSRFPGRAMKGHRDVFGTECPGDALYNAIPKMRSSEKAERMLP
jgi:hypothetical protein